MEKKDDMNNEMENLITDIEAIKKRSQGNIKNEKYNIRN